jgi:hypothetical protein
MDEFGDPHWPLVPLPSENQNYNFDCLLAPVQVEPSSGGTGGSGNNTGQGPQGYAQVNGHNATNIGNQAYFVPRYTGEDGVTLEEFIEAVTFTQYLGEWTDEQMIVVARLRLGGAAEEYVRANKDLILVNWESLNEGLRSRFSARVPRYALEKKFIACLQKKGESAAEFSTRLQVLGSQVEKSMISENDNKPVPAGLICDHVLHQFLSGFRKELRRFFSSQGT